jgi:hypothetical protein
MVGYCQVPVDTINDLTNSSPSYAYVIWLVRSTSIHRSLTPMSGKYGSCGSSGYSTDSIVSGVRVGTGVSVGRGVGVSVGVEVGNGVNVGKGVKVGVGVLVDLLKSIFPIRSCEFPEKADTFINERNGAPKLQDRITIDKRIAATKGRELIFIVLLVKIYSEDGIDGSTILRQDWADSAIRSR